MKRAAPSLGSTRRSRWWLAAAVGFLLGLVWQAPAAWVANAVASLSADQLLLTEARGTVWKGQAQVVLAGGAGAEHALALAAPIEWRLGVHWAQPTRGVVLALRHAEALPSPLQLRFGPSEQGWGFDITSASPHSTPEARVPASLLAGLGAPWNSIQPRGRMALRIERFYWNPMASAGQPALSAALTLHLQQVASRLSTLPVLGDYRLTVSTLGSVWELALDSSAESALQLQGTGRWSPGSRLQFQGIASALPPSEAALGNLLNILGRRDGPRSVITL